VVGAERRGAGYLLDSNVIVAAFEEEPGVLERLGRTPTGRLFVPAVALGELYYGALKSRRTEANLRRLEGFAAASNVLGVDAAVARRYGEIRDALRRIGRPIPENDVWIAATALRHDLVLVTRDSHFEHVEGLELERW
jgi:tRNA(fMet)-specific endonuclease VapC